MFGQLYSLLHSIGALSFRVLFLNSERKSVKYMRLKLKNICLQSSSSSGMMPVSINAREKRPGTWSAQQTGSRDINFLSPKWNTSLVVSLNIVLCILNLNFIPHRKSCTLYICGDIFMLIQIPFVSIWCLGVVL